MDQTYASRPKPMGVPAVSPAVGSPVGYQQEDLVAGIRPGVRRLRSMDADEVITAATDFAMAIRRLARNATSTVSRL
jgi:lipid-binding SYLF domain-containing protein